MHRLSLDIDISTCASNSGTANSLLIRVLCEHSTVKQATLDVERMLLERLQDRRRGTDSSREGKNRHQAHRHGTLKPLHGVDCSKKGLTKREAGAVGGSSRLM